MAGVGWAARGGWRYLGIGLTMARKREGILDVLVGLPWWVSVGVAVGAYVGVRSVIPYVLQDSPATRETGRILSQFAWLAGVFFLIPAPFAAWRAHRNRRRLDSQSGIESIRSLPWNRFEQLLAEAFRRQRYVVRENTCAGPDGGVDLRIEKNGNLYLVQCKQWLSKNVGVTVVREVFGILTAERAAGAIIVTSGMFTQEAKAFARGKPIDLVEGNQLAAMIRSVQTRPEAADEAGEPAGLEQRPKCGRKLVLREAKRGPHAGSQFWGCSGYPNCRFTRDAAG